MGVLFLGWSVFPLVLLYWLENVVVGGFNVAKLLFAQPRELIKTAADLRGQRAERQKFAGLPTD